MPIPVPVLTGGADGTGFTTASFATVSGDLYELTIFCASDVASPSVVDSEAVAWTRLDDPSQFSNEPIMRYAARGSGGTITVTLSFTGTGGAIGYVLARCPTVAGTTPNDAYQVLPNGFRAQKGAPFTPGDNIPAAFADPDNVASIAFAGTQFGTWAGGTDWNGGVQPTPVQTALGLSNVTQVGRSQTNPNISVDLILTYGVDGSAAYGITWTSGPFTSRSIYSEIIAAAAPSGVVATIAETSPARVDSISAPVNRASAAETSPARTDSIAAPVNRASVGETSPARADSISAPVVRAAASETSPARVDAITVAAAFTGEKDPLPFDVAQIHSGHSLTDPGFHPWPGPWVYLLTEVLDVSVFANIAKATIPGSPLAYRWANEATLNPSARFDIADWEVLVITEGVPLPLDGSSETTLALYAANAWTNGNGGLGAPTLLFTTWTNIDGTDGPFRAMLDTYEPEWEAMADAATAALPPGAPPVFLIPGHRLMARFYDDIENDLAPSGVTEIGDYFRDTIHLNDLGAYAWAMLHYACMFGVSPVGLPRDLWGPNQGWGDDNVEGPPTIPTLEQATYIQEAVWDVVTSYERTGVSAAADVTATIAETSPARVDSISAPVNRSAIAETSPARVDSIAAPVNRAAVAETSPARTDSISAPVNRASVGETSPARADSILVGLVPPISASIAETSPARTDSIAAPVNRASSAEVSPARTDSIRLSVVFATISETSPARVDSISTVEANTLGVIGRLSWTHTPARRLSASWSPTQ